MSTPRPLEGIPDPPARVLVVDNYDSFTYNLVQILGELRAVVVVHRNDEVDAESLNGIAPSHVILSPGPRTPREAGVCVGLVRRWSGRVPILGVCLGHQCIAEAFGARIGRYCGVVHGRTSSVRHDGRGVFEGTPSPIRVARYHSLTVDPRSLPPELVPSAFTQDGLLMAIRHRDHPTEGIQFHPESYLTEGGPRFLRNFLRRTSCRTSPTV